MIIHPVGAELLGQTARLTDWLAGWWWSWSRFSELLRERACVLCVKCVFVGGFTVFKPIDYFSWNLVWTLCHWSHTHHHNFSGLRKLDDDKQCGRCMNVWGRSGSSTTDCRLLKLCVMVCWEKYPPSVGTFKCKIRAWEHSYFCAGATLAPIQCPEVMHLFRSWENMQHFYSNICVGCTSITRWKPYDILLFVGARGGGGGK